MSIKAVRAAYQVFHDNKDMLSCTDEEILDLITAIAKHILDTPLPSSGPPIPEGYISIGEFDKKYSFVAGNTLYRYCQKESFTDACAFLRQRRWYVHPEKVREYLKKENGIYRKRMERQEFNKY